MKNKKRIGDYYERKVVKELASEGFVVYKPTRTKFSPKDIWGLFDIVAWHPKNGWISFVQVKKNKKEYTKEVIKKFDEFARNLSALFVELVFFEKGGVEEYKVYKWNLKRILSENDIIEFEKDLVKQSQIKEIYGTKRK